MKSMCCLCAIVLVFGARCVSAEDGRCLGVLRGHEGRVNCLAFSPDGRVLASGSQDNTIRLWNMITRESVRTPRYAGTGIMDVVFSDDGTMLASWGASVSVWETATGIRAAKFDPLVASPLRFARDGKNLMWVDSWEDDMSARNNIETMTGLEDGRAIVRLWNWGTGVNTPIADLRGRIGISVASAFSPDGTMLAIGEGDRKGLIEIWNLATEERVTSFCHGGVSRKYGLGGVLTLAFDPSSSVLATGGTDHTIRVWDVATGKGIATFDGQPDLVLSLGFSKDGRILVAGGTDKFVRLCDIQAGRTIDSLDTGCAIVNSVSLHGAVVATSGDNTIKLWNVASIVSQGKERKRETGQTEIRDESLREEEAETD